MQFMQFFSTLVLAKACEILDYGWHLLRKSKINGARENMVKVIGSCNNDNQTERNWQQTAEGQTSWDIPNIHTHTQAVNRWWVVLPKTGLLDTLWTGWCVRAGTEHELEKLDVNPVTLVEGRDYTPLKCELAHLLDMQGLRKWCGMSRMFIPGTEGRRCASTSVTDAVDETTVAFRANISRVTVERSKDTMLALVNISYFFCVQINPPFMLLLCLISLLAFSLYIQTCVVFMQMQYNRISIFHN